MLLFADDVTVPEVVVEAPHDEPPPPPVRPPQPKPKLPVSIRADGGYAPRKLFSLPVTGADVGLAAGVQPKGWLAFWGGGRGFIGSTENGLRTFDLRLLLEAEVLPFDRLRLGLGGGAFLLGVDRAARDETIRTWGPIFEIGARFDVVRADGYAMFVRVAETAGYDLYDSSVWIGPSFGAGFELDVAGSHARATSRTGSAAARPPSHRW